MRATAVLLPLLVALIPMLSRAGDTDQQSLLGASAETIVLHFHPDILGLDTTVRGLREGGYPVLAVRDGTLREVRVLAYLNRRGPMEFNQQDVFESKVDFLMMKAYDAIFGEPD